MSSAWRRTALHKKRRGKKEGGSSPNSMGEGDRGAYVIRIRESSITRNDARAKCRAWSPGLEIRSKQEEQVAERKPW